MHNVPTFLINLDKDVDRLAFMKRQFDFLELPFDRFPAISGKDIPDWARPWFFSAQGSRQTKLTPGEVGVYTSHISIHRIIVENKIPYALVFEDDVKIERDMIDFIQSIDNFGFNWDIIRLSNNPKSPFVKIDDFGDKSEIIYYYRVPNNLGGYLISYSGAIKTTSFRGIRTHAIDEDFRRPWEIDIRTYGVFPPPCTANVLGYSSIDSMGNRKLGQETYLQKLRRRRFPGPINISKQFIWHIRHAGFCFLLEVFSKRIKRLIRGKQWYVKNLRAK